MLLAISVTISALWRYVAAHRDLLEPDVTDEDVAAMTLLTAPNMGFYAVVVLLALLAPAVAAFGYLAIAVIALFRTRGDSTAHPRPPDQPRRVPRDGRAQAGHRPRGTTAGQPDIASHP